MPNIAIKDIYAGMPDAKDEIITDSTEKFLESFVVPPELPSEDLLNGKKFLITGYKGVGKTAVLYYLQDLAKKKDPSTCASFIYFKSDFEEVRKSTMEFVAKKLTAVVDVSGKIQPEKVEFLHIWRWVFFKKIVEDNEDFSNGIFAQDENWSKFVKEVNKISFSSNSKKVISLSSLKIKAQISAHPELSAEANTNFKSVSNDEESYEELINIIDRCENLFHSLKRTDIPYYIFVDEMEAFCGDQELYQRDLTLIRDMIFTIHRLNSTKKVHIIAAVRNEIIFAMDRFIQTKELNKILDGYSVPIKWSYSNTNSYKHPIIEILMKRISVADNGAQQHFQDWFPAKVNNKDTVNYILDNGWNKPRDIVRFLIAAQNDSLHCNEKFFSQACLDTLKKEYSKNSLAEIRQELQSMYTSKEIEMVIALVRGGPRITTAEKLRKRAAKGSNARIFWDERKDDILEDFYRVGFWGNVNRSSQQYTWRWNHKGDTGVLLNEGWELVIHSALLSELAITPY